MELPNSRMVDLASEVESMRRQLKDSDAEIRRIEEKAKFTEDQVKESMGPEVLKKFSLLKFHVNGSSPMDARNQDLATVDFRVFAQTTDRDLLRMSNPYGFFRLSMVTFLEGVPVCIPPSHPFEANKYPREHHLEMI